MDVLTGGFNQGNLIVTGIIILGLIIGSSKAKMLDSAGVAAATFIGLVVGGMGHWTWLLILLAFLLASHKATKWRFEEKIWEEKKAASVVYNKPNRIHAMRVNAEPFLSVWCWPHDSEKKCTVVNW